MIIKTITIECVDMRADVNRMDSLLTLELTEVYPSFIRELSINDIVMNVDRKEELVEALNKQILEERETNED